MDEKLIWQAISDEELLAEVANRGLEVPSAVGATATQAAGVETAGLSSEQQKFQERTAIFIDPERRMDTSEQLDTMSEFWAKLAYNMPELSADQQAKLQEQVEAHPERRVAPTPLLGFNERQMVAERARNFPGQQFNSNYDALWTPGQDWLYGKLLRDPENAVKEGRETYGLLYKTPAGELVSRADYVSALKDAGQIVEDEDGNPWIFPVMDVAVKSPRHRSAVRALYAEIDPTVAPESLITTQLLHQAAGTPNEDWAVDFANEAVYELDKKGDPKALVDVAGVSWGPSDRQVNLGSWYADRRSVGFGVRGAESGL